MRKGALFTSLAILAGSLAVGASTAQAAVGDYSEAAVTATYIPSGSGVTTITRVVTIPSGGYLVTGTAGSTAPMLMWKLKADFSVDTAFGTNGIVDLGTAYKITNTELPTGSRTIVVDERLKKIVVTATFSAWITGGNSQSTVNFNIALVLDLSTGAILSTYKSADYTNLPGIATAVSATSYPMNDKTLCESVFGATVNGVALSSTRAANYGALTSPFRPDGSVLLSTSCDYSNSLNLGPSTPGAMKSYSGSIIAAYKASGSSLVLDTTFGTNGYISTPNIATKCATLAMSNVDTGITSNTSTSMYSLVARTETALTTTIPSWYQGNNWVTAFEGCNTGPSLTTPTYYPMQANGTLKTALSLPTGMTVGNGYSSNFVIDPAGRWVSIASVTNGSTTTYSALRLNTNGTPDTTLGAGGLKALTLPSTVTLGGVSRPVTFRLSGMITTTDEVFFAGYIGYGTYPQNCNQPGSYSTMTRPFIVSLKSAGLVTTFGSSGIGQEYTVTGTTTSCGAFPTSLNTFISKTGAHFGLAYGTSSMKTVTWQPVPGVTGGGEGGTGTGGATNDTGGKPFTGASNGLSRADTTVYKKLPTSTGEDFAFRALSAAEAKTAELVSLTPKVCITFNRSVLTVNPGKCRVEVRDKATDEVLRKLTTIVEEDGSSDEGSTADSIDPILFTEASAKLSKAARAQLKEIVEATESAGTILVVGHSASLTENSPSNWLISLNRARAVRAAMIKAGVKAPIQVLALGSKAPVETKKTEKAQSQNRRVEIFILPAASPAA